MNLRARFTGFCDRELAWDFHCSADWTTYDSAIAEEAQRRGVDLCHIEQQRKGGPFVPGAKFRRPPCGGCQKGKRAQLTQ